jgi:hypothetical protein
MKRAITLTVLCLLAGAMLPALAEAATKDCFSITSSEWKLCGEKKQALVLKLKNVCVETMQLKLCIEKEGGEWDCKWFREIKKETDVEMESCDNTGNYRISACEDIDDCPDKPEKKP